MNKSKLVYFFLAINLFYSFSNCNYFFPSFITSLVATPVITGAISVPCLALHKALNKPLLSALKPTIIIGCGSSSIAFFLLFLNESSRELNTWSGLRLYNDNELKAIAAGFAAGIGVATSSLWIINKWLVKKYENNAPKG